MTDIRGLMPICENLCKTEGVEDNAVCCILILGIWNAEDSSRMELTVNLANCNVTSNRFS